MKLFIKCANGATIGHPVTLENLLMIYPHFDVNNPPDDYIRFIRAAVPAISSPYIIYECKYNVQELECNETYISRLMTDEEKQLLFVEMQNSKPFPSWVLNYDSCTWEPPLPYPTDDNNKYTWNEETTSWELVPELPE